MYYEDLGEYGIITFTLKNKIIRILKINMYLLILLFGPKRFFNKNNKMTQIKGRKIIKQQKQNEKAIQLIFKSNQDKMKLQRHKK